MDIRQTQIMLGDLKLPKDRLIFDGIDVSAAPIFSVSEVTKVFFARTPQWLRRHDWAGDLVLDGQYVGGYRDDKGRRRFDLSHIEKMGHALAGKGVIDGAQLQSVAVMVHNIARLYGYL